MSRRVGVVTVAHGRHDHLRAQHATLARGTRLPEVYVVVAVDDRAIGSVLPDSPPAPLVVPIESDPAGLPMAAARNRGMDAAMSLGCEVLIGLDVDCLAAPQLVAAYAEVAAAHPASVWSGPVTYLDPPGAGGYPLDGLADLDAPHPARPAPPAGAVEHGGDPELFWSLSYATSRSGWVRSGGFDEQFVGYGAEDTDFGQRAARAGLALSWVGAARAYHQHHPVSRPPVEHLDDILSNGRLYRARWGRWPMRGWLAEFEHRGLIRRRGDDYERIAGPTSR